MEELNRWFEINNGRIIKSNPVNYKIKNKNFCPTREESNINDISILDGLITYEKARHSIYVDVFKVSENTLIMNTFVDGIKIDVFTNYKCTEFIFLCYIQDIEEHIDFIKDCHGPYNYDELLDEIYPDLVK